MDIAIEQLNYYFNQLNTEEQNSILNLVQTIVKGKGESSERISLDQYNIELEEAIAKAERGETLSHEEVVALSKQW